MHEWQREASKLLEERGFVRVHTADVHDREWHDTFGPWLKGTFVGLSIGKTYVHHGHRGLGHISLMKGQTPTVKLYEFARVYDDWDKYQEGIYLSVMTEQERLDTEAGDVYATIVELPFVKTHLIRSRIAPIGRLQYGPDKMDAGLILARCKI